MPFDNSFDAIAPLSPGLGAASPRDVNLPRHLIVSLDTATRSLAPNGRRSLAQVALPN